MANSKRSPARLAFWVPVLMFAAPARAQDPVILGPEAAACRTSNGTVAALVTVEGFKDRDGQLRVQTYTGIKGEYLEGGRSLRRHDVPMSPAGAMAVCVTFPAAGAYAIVALHDRDSNGKLSIWSDGIGFSNNPRLKLAKPAAEQTLHFFGAGVTPIRIVMNYRRGFSVRPLDR